MLNYYLSMVTTKEDEEKVLYIYQNFYSFMCHTAREFLHNEADVEDIVHNSILKIVENPNIIDLSDPKRAKNFCGIIARNKAIDFLRVKSNQVLGFDDIPGYSQSAEDNTANIVISNESYNELLKEINNMKVIYRDTCVLKFLYEYKEREIALILDISEKAVNQRIYRARHSLIKKLKKEYSNDGSLK